MTPHEKGFYACVEAGLDNGLDSAIRCNPFNRLTSDSVEFYHGWKEAQGKQIMTFKKKE